MRYIRAGRSSIFITELCDDGYNTREAKTSEDCLDGNNSAITVRIDGKKKRKIYGGGGGERDGEKRMPEQTPGDCVLTADIVSPITKRLFNIGRPHSIHAYKIVASRTFSKAHSTNRIRQIALQSRTSLA